ncbi:MAG: OmpA family protein [Gammaproteobacteria bacterium]|nr:MAG: OmpA family protein [Gammaproteobacteria bacterium]
MFRIYLIIFIVTAACSCASAPKSYPPLAEAKAALEKTKKKAGIFEVASVTLFEADEQLKHAETALNENDTDSVDHYVYLATRKQQIAQELLLKHQQEQELINLKQQQHEMIAHARRTESTRASSETRKAQQRIQQLEKTLGQYKAEETSRGTILVINDLLFNTGGANLKPQSQRRLEPLVQYLQGNSQREIIIEGHTDSIGNPQVNKQLSLQRADTVKEFLMTRGIDSNRVETRGFGEEVPVATNTTNAGRSLNRRVEVVIKTPGQ